MIDTLQQILCSFLFAVGLLFIIIELRSRYDVSFLFFGISLILYSALTSIDIFIIPTVSSVQDLLYWVRIFHVLSLILIPVLIVHILSLAKLSLNQVWLRLLVLSVILLSVLMMNDLMLAEKNGLIQQTLLYWIIFVPFAVFSMGILLRLIIQRMRTAETAEKKILRSYLFGFTGLVICGSLDLIVSVFIGQAQLPIKSFTSLGVFLYGFSTTFVFTERFLMILKDRKDTYDKLKTAYKDLEEVNALKQLGESSAIINHEIKNYLFMISGNAQLIQERESLSENGKKRVADMVTSIDRLNTFTEDILDLSRAQIIKHKNPLNLFQLIQGCIDKNFADQREFFEISIENKEQYVYGDWEKLEHVFVNIFKNAREAAVVDSLPVNIKLLPSENVFLVRIEDFGQGCTRDQLDNLFKAFYTTKKGRMGTGLGLSITRTIVESHGGRISAYSKNVANPAEHGLVLQLTFPRYYEGVQVVMRKYPIILVKEGLSCLDKIIRVFQNVQVNPYIVQNLADLEYKEFKQESMKVLLNTKQIQPQTYKKIDEKKWFLISDYQNSPYILEGTSADAKPQVFSEEYIISHLV